LNKLNTILNNFTDSGNLAEISQNLAGFFSEHLIEIDIFEHIHEIPTKFRQQFEENSRFE